MTSKDRRAEDREALERLLESHGADRTRWPARERLRFASVISEDALAGRMLAEAQALDRLLDQAPRASEASIEALKGRILAAALRSEPPRLKAVDGDRPMGGKTWIGSLRRPGLAAKFAEWPTAAVLAASLMVGVVLGTAGTFDSAMQQVATVAGLSSAASSTDSAHLALGEEVLGQSDEDLL